MTEFVNVADLKYGDCINCRWTGILNPSGMCPWCEEEFGALAEKWQATRERVRREKASDPWRAQREHAQGEAVLEALNLIFYRRCKALGIEANETLAHATRCRY